MDIEKNFPILFNILSSEQQILQRSDQKAFTLLSILGVFAVFFIVHYTKIPPNVFSFTFIFIYFFSVLCAIFYLLLVISPRIRNIENDPKKKMQPPPIYFGGIVLFKSPTEYAEHLSAILKDSNAAYEVFVSSIYSIGRINAYKNKFLKFGIIFFIIAITCEIVIIVSLYYNILISS